MHQTNNKFKMQHETFINHFINSCQVNILINRCNKRLCNQNSCNNSFCDFFACETCINNHILTNHQTLEFNLTMWDKYMIFFPLYNFRWQAHLPMRINRDWLKINLNNTINSINLMTLINSAKIILVKAS